jgi:hypothetical protein
MGKIKDLMIDSTEEDMDLRSTMDNFHKASQEKIKEAMDSIHNKYLGNPVTVDGDPEETILTDSTDQGWTLTLPPGMTFKQYVPLLGGYDAGYSDRSVIV